MNIFYLHENPRVAANHHCDIHINKMIIESAQMLSTAVRVLHDPVGRVVTIPGKPKLKHLHLAPGDRIVDGVLTDTKFMLNTHINHPCNIWVRESSANFKYLIDLADELDLMWYKWRGRHHNSWTKLNISAFNMNSVQFNSDVLTKPARAMPILYYRKTVVESYRAYYTAKLKKWLDEPTKVKYACYSNREVPSWLNLES